jgi:HlyD family secretion protein
MRIRRSWITWGAGVAVSGVAMAMLLRPSPVEVEWAVAGSGAFRVTLEADGISRSRSKYVITMPVTGRLERVLLQAGDSVQGGTVVARVAPLPLDPATIAQVQARLGAAEARVTQARTASAQAFRDVSRARIVEDAGALSRQQLESATLLAEARVAELRAAEAELAAATAAARASGPGAPLVTVRSPVRGQVLRVPEASARVTVAGTAILELANAADLEIVADLLSTDAVRVAPGMLAEVDGWGGEAEHVMQARVRRIEPVATTRVSALGVDEQRVNVILDFVTPCETLGDGYRLTARFVLWEGDRILSVPSSAVFREGDHWKLFVVQRGRARAREVSIGRRSDAGVEIRSGIAAGDTVVVFPSDRVFDDTRLQLNR